ncbi:MAG: hypothetical protein KC910_06405 [Candidatus Eremiobacteraeota bacterium]|nr:hypothetical protein [Candidatus Eremiobacteraeota bacterium]
MLVSSAKVPPTERKPPRKDSSPVWGSEVGDLLLRLDQEQLHDIGNLFKSIAGGMKGAWKQIQNIPRQLLNLPIIKDRVDDGARSNLTDLASTIGTAVGYGAAGVQGLAGGMKLVSGRNQHDRGRMLEGLVDLNTAAVIAFTVAGLPGARDVAAPLAAALNVFRGGVNAGQGFLRRDARFQLQGVLDATRSMGTLGRLLKDQAAIFHTVGIVFAPIAGALQLGRGLHDFSVGMKNTDNKKELEGLADMAAAVGTALAFTSGVAVIPGIALAVAANLVKVGYQVSPRFRAKVDAKLDKYEPQLARVADTIDRFGDPLQARFRKLVEKLFPNRVEAPPPEQITPAQVAEFANLLSVDGHFSRLEEKRLRTVLEEAGLKSLMPDRHQPPPPLARRQLQSELDTPDQRGAFFEFMLVVASFEADIEAPERDYLLELGHDLGYSDQQMADQFDLRRV